MIAENEFTGRCFMEGRSHPQHPQGEICRKTQLPEVQEQPQEGKDISGMLGCLLGELRENKG